jgi:diacylglycerol kinase family enzyme
MSKELEEQLSASLPNTIIKRVKTDHAGHAEDIAYRAARATKRPLVISVSGDGGYHEVVNGLMKAQQDGARPVAGLLPGGNANDHYRTLHEGDIVPRIAAGDERHIDLLKITTTVKGKAFTRYGHSYIGIGLTPKAGNELNKTKLNAIKELWIVARSIMTLSPVRIIVHGQKQAYDSLVFSNIDSMSKVLTLSKHAEVHDGKFEVTGFKKRNKLHLLRLLLRASTLGLRGTTHAKKFVFTTTKPLLVQIDGEIVTVDAGTDVTITSEYQVLRCVI